MGFRVSYQTLNATTIIGPKRYPRNVDNNSPFHIWFRFENMCTAFIFSSMRKPCYKTGDAWQTSGTECTPITILPQFVRSLRLPTLQFLLYLHSTDCAYRFCVHVHLLNLVGAEYSTHPQAACAKR